MHLFLSHASESKSLVRGIAAALPAHVTWWLDQDELSPGHRFGEHIEQAIGEGCDFLIVFLDENALAREWVPREVALGLRREADLKRTFVIPVLLEDVRDRLSAAGDLADRLYLTAWDHSPEGLQTASRQLSEQLFALASRMIEDLRDLGRRGMLDAFAKELTDYKQAAFQWRASLGNRIAVLLGNQAAFDHVRDSVAAYNRVSDVFIPRLALHRDRITNAWSSHRGLCDDVRDLIGSVESVYRGKMFRLNEIHELVHVAEASAPAAATLEEFDQRRAGILAEAAAALDGISERATRVIAALEREIE